MAWNLKQLDNGDLEFSDLYESKTPPNVIIGRGTTDTDVSFVGVRDKGGTLRYIYPATSAGGTVFCTTSRP